MKNLLKLLDSRLEVVSVLDKSDRAEFVSFLSSSSARVPNTASEPLNGHSTYMRTISDLPLEARQVFIYVKFYKK